MNSTSTVTQVVGLNANFDANYQAIDSANVDPTASSYTANAGDTLQTVALAVWGDASLWYLLANANGLSAGTTLAAGQVLSVPGKVANLHNNSSTFKPYDPNDTVGNTAPTQPQTKHGCGTFGDVLALVVSTAVALLVPGGTALWGAINAAAADVAYQGVEIAVGNQSKFNWGELASSAIAGGIMGSVSKYVQMGGRVANAIARTALSSAVHQGVNMALGLQKKFSWSSLAVDSISAGLVEGFAAANGISTSNMIDPKTGKSVTVAVKATSSQSLLIGAADVLSKTVTNTVLTGKDFGKSLMEYLPDTVGGTIGNMIGDALTTRPLGVRQPTPIDSDGAITPYVPDTLGQSPDGSLTGDSSRTSTDGNYLDFSAYNSIGNLKLNTDLSFENQTHKVQTGENFTGIAKDYMTNTLGYKSFTEADVRRQAEAFMIDNGIATPSGLRPGTDLILRDAAAQRSDDSWDAASSLYNLDIKHVQEVLAFRNQRAAYNLMASVAIDGLYSLDAALRSTSASENTAASGGGGNVVKHTLSGDLGNAWSEFWGHYPDLPTYVDRRFSLSGLTDDMTFIGDTVNAFGRAGGRGAVSLGYRETQDHHTQAIDGKYFYSYAGETTLHPLLGADGQQLLVTNGPTRTSGHVDYSQFTKLKSREDSVPGAEFSGVIGANLFAAIPLADEDFAIGIKSLANKLGRLEIYSEGAGSNFANLRFRLRSEPNFAPEIGGGGGGGGGAETVAPKGWNVGDDIYSLTKAGNEPAWSTVRGRFWKNEAATPQYGTWDADQLARMQQGLAPQRFNLDKGGIESMDLSHEPIPFRNGGKDIVPKWPQEHAAGDPYRRPGY